MKKHDNNDTGEGWGVCPIRPCRRSAPAGMAGLMALALALASPGLAAGATTQARAAAKATPAAGKKAQSQSVEERLGVHIRGIRLSAAGFMLDLRYRILDTDKAAFFLDRKIVPYLMDSAGARLGVASSPKIGQLRSTQRGAIRLDRDYSMLFGNPGRYLQQGSKITLVIGEQKIENITVE